LKMLKWKLLIYVQAMTKKYKKLKNKIQKNKIIHVSVKKNKNEKNVVKSDPVVKLSLV